MFDQKFSGILNKKILERKPGLKLCSNHYKCGPRMHRVWNSKMQGTAVSDGRGWYKSQESKGKKNG